jgi:hypothetical protein
MIIPETLAHAYDRANWTDRPLWFWEAVASDEGLPGVREPWTMPGTDLVFCEDLSRFLERGRARRFVMGVGSNPLRWVADPDAAGVPELAGVSYQPARRLAL